MYLFTTSALHPPCLVRASFANKRNSTAGGWGLGAQCLCLEPKFSPCVPRKSSHEHTSSFFLALKIIFIYFNKQTSITLALPSFLSEPQSETLTELLAPPRLGSPKKSTGISASSELQEKLPKFSPTDKNKPTDNTNIQKNLFSLVLLVNDSEYRTAFWY